MLHERRVREAEEAEELLPVRGSEVDILAVEVVAVVDVSAVKVTFVVNVSAFVVMFVHGGQC